MTSFKTINLFHVFFTGPLLIYIGLANDIPNAFYNTLLLLSMLLTLYLVYLIFQNNKRTWLIIHLFVFLPLLFWTAISKENTPYMIKSILLAIGCAAIGYHLIYIIKRALRNV